MMTPKQVLIEDNRTRPEADRIPVKEGKGRLSKAANDRILWLIENKGVKVKGYNVTQTVATPDTAQTVVIKKENPTNEKVISDYTILYDENAYQAVARDGKVFGMREVCNTCRVSLVQNMCENPTILGDIAVVIKPRA